MSSNSSFIKSTIVKKVLLISPTGTLYLLPCFSVMLAQTEFWICCATFHSQQNGKKISEKKFPLGAKRGLNLLIFYDF